MANLLKGVYSAFPLFLTESYEADFDATVKHIEGMAKAGVNGLFFGGTMGQRDYWPEGFAKGYYSRVVFLAKETSPNTKILLGVADKAFKGSFECIRDRILDTRGLYIDGIVVHPPYKSDSLEFSQEGLFEFYTTVARISKHPVIIYNNPGKSENPLNLETLRKLSENGNIAGVKNSAYDLELARALCGIQSDNFGISIGHEKLLYDAVMAGADGITSGAGANLAPSILINMLSAREKGDYKAMQREQERVDALLEFCGPDDWLVSIHYGLELKHGIKTGAIFEPMGPISIGQKEKVEWILRKVGELE